MKTYVTISISEKDIENIGEKEDSKFMREIDDVVYQALNLMVGNRLVQLKITNLPMREEA